MSQQMPEPGTPEPNTDPPEEQEEGDKYDGGEIPAAAPLEEEDPES